MKVTGMAKDAAAAGGKHASVRQPKLKFSVEPDISKMQNPHEKSKQKGEAIPKHLKQRINYNELLFMLTDSKNPYFTKNEMQAIR